MIKTFEGFKLNENDFDFEIEEKSKSVISNFDPIVEKYEEIDNYFSVLIKDKNSDFNTWLDISFDDGESYSDWNQMIYYKTDYNDMVKQLVENSEGILDLCAEIAISYLISEEKVYDDDEEGYVHYKDYWYVKDGFKESGIDYETAKSSRAYNL